VPRASSSPSASVQALKRIDRSLEEIEATLAELRRSIRNEVRGDADTPARSKSGGGGGKNRSKRAAKASSAKATKAAKAAAKAADQRATASNVATPKDARAEVDSPKSRALRAQALKAEHQHADDSGAGTT
jgi:hypothetical protein